MRRLDLGGLEWGARVGGFLAGCVGGPPVWEVCMPVPRLLPSLLAVGQKVT